MRAVLTATMNPRPLAAARIIVGLVAVGFSFEWGRILLRASSGNFLALPVVSGWSSVHPPFVAGLFALSMGASLAMVMGLAGRLPAALVAVTAGVALLADEQTYSNHLVLLMMMATWLSLSSADQAFSLSRSPKSKQVPYWPAFLIKMQITTLYGWTAIAKINEQYLSGEVVGTYVHSWMPISAQLLPAAAVLSILAEAFLSVALWIPSLRKIGYLVGAGLHVGIVVFLDSPAPLVGFGALMLSGYVIFAYGKPIAPSATYSPVATMRS
jgi:Vitamin K-dependent gamma-carboxylase